MAGIFSFKCAQCGEIHEGSPSFSFSAPAPFLEQSAEIQTAAQLGEDTCRYEDEDGHHYFIRACLEIPIHSVAEPFLWGIWVSLSQQSFQHYLDTYDQPDVLHHYFGWFCNYLPYYPNTYALKTKVHPQAGNTRPIIELEKTDHLLSIDFHQGISCRKAQEIAEFVMHREPQ
jgi:hypothetical protein